MLAKDVIDAAVRGEGPLGKCAPDEPVFIVRAQDALAAETVERWAIRARAMDVGNHKVQDALALAEEMRDWHTKKIPD
jgi:hypothetical protein